MRQRLQYGFLTNAFLFTIEDMKNFFLQMKLFYSIKVSIIQGLITTVSDG